MKKVNLLSKAEMKRVIGGGVPGGGGSSDDCKSECTGTADCSNGTTCVGYDFGDACDTRIVNKCTLNHSI